MIVLVFLPFLTALARRLRCRWWKNGSLQQRLQRFFRRLWRPRGLLLLVLLLLPFPLLTSTFVLPTCHFHLFTLPRQRHCTLPHRLLKKILTPLIKLPLLSPKPLIVQLLQLHRRTGSLPFDLSCPLTIPSLIPRKTGLNKASCCSLVNAHTLRFINRIRILCKLDLFKVLF